MKICLWCLIYEGLTDNEHPEEEVGGMTDDGWICDKCSNEALAGFDDGVPSDFVYAEA